ncbi:uncharacterized protein [Clytia hemisphaerica]|uniref:LamG-like jellyroll fold domain-containing protein n=1 Tax=Clytia hemisphaerica TaxID=252671 RepID=A0A7M5UMU0_9CNID
MIKKSLLLIFVLVALHCRLSHAEGDYSVVSNLRNHLVGHWKMNEEQSSYVDDDSGHELHGVAYRTSIRRGKFTRARYFPSSTSSNIVVPKRSPMNFGRKSFSFAGWLKAEDYAYPHTGFSARQGFGCYFAPGRLGFTPGWDIGHGHSASNDYTYICIRDEHQQFVHQRIRHNAGSTGAALLNKWTHYAVVFDRDAQRVYLYINGKKQDDYADISKVKGSIDNKKPLNFGTLYGWKTKGTMDDYRMYNIALDNQEVQVIYEDHRV